jgi:hypothetical protein
MNEALRPGADGQLVDRAADADPLPGAKRVIAHWRRAACSLD